MELSTPVLVVLLVVVATFSALAGGVVARALLQPDGEKKDDDEEKDNRDAPPPALPEERRPDRQKLLCVVRSPDGRVNVSARGQTYRHLREIQDPEVGYETIEALKAVLQFTEGWLSALQKTTVRPAPETPSGDQQAFLEQLRQNDLFPKRVTGTIDWLRQPIRPPSPSAEPPPLRTPAEQIDDLVQQRLLEQPDLARTPIRLSTAADGGLRIHVGQQVYSAVSDIPDPRTKALIQDAIREWEST